jgi:hypothetical protein
MRQGLCVRRDWYLEETTVVKFQSRPTNKSSPVRRTNPEWRLTIVKGVVVSAQKEQNIAMATQGTVPGLPENLQLELEEVARAQKRPVGDVLAEAVTAYLEERSWQRVIQSARARTKALGINEEDVPRLIAESRAGHER